MIDMHAYGFHAFTENLHNYLGCMSSSYQGELSSIHKNVLTLKIMDSVIKKTRPKTIEGKIFLTLILMISSMKMFKL